MGIDGVARRTWEAMLVLAVWLIPVMPVCGTSIESAEFPSLISSVQVAGPVAFCGEHVPLEIQEVKERLEKEMLLSVWNRAQVILWLKRSRRFLPQIETMLKDSKMPDDLKYVAVVESALLPHAYSAKGAVGFWQFLADTGRRYGLVIDERIDERRSLRASTQAAIRYLEELHSTLGSWTLAVAGFNMGEDRLAAEILEQETNDYYNLHLPDETQRFLLRIVSVKLILSDPEKYGFKLAEEDYYPPTECDQIQIHCPDSIPIRFIAKAAKTHFKTIRLLNPEIRGRYLASGTYNLSVPKGESEGFHARFQSLVSEYLAEQGTRIYVIKKGDNLSSIAKKFDIPLATLLICNNLDPRRPIYPGNKLIICTNN